MGCGASAERDWKQNSSHEQSPLEQKCMVAVRAKAKEEPDLKKLLRMVPQCTDYFNELKAVFEKYDVDKSGTLEPAEVEAFAQEAKLIPMSSSLGDIFNECDLNHDVKFNYNEFMVYMPMIHLAMAADQIQHEAAKEVQHMEIALKIMCPLWSTFDADGSGTITISEAMEVARQQGSENLAAKLFDEMDFNDDGEITFKEFLRGFQGLKKYKNLLDDAEGAHQNGGTAFFSLG